jgi:hypothetical protein
MLSRAEDKCISVEWLIYIVISSLIGIIFLIIISRIGSANPYSSSYASVEVISIGLAFIIYFNSYRTRSVRDLKEINPTCQAEIVVILISRGPR